MAGRRRRKTIEGQMELLDAVSKTLRKHGFVNLKINKVAEESGMDKTAIYRYFGDFEGLLKAYVEKQDYWLKSLRDFENIKDIDIKELTKLFIKEQIELLIKNKEFQQLILWELADRDGIATPITVKRELYSKGILEQSRNSLNNCGINFNFILSVILGGIYYIIIHKDIETFCEVDLLKKDHKDELIKTINWLIDLLFKENESIDKVEHVAINAYNKGIDIDTIAEITKLSKARIKEITTN